MANGGYLQASWTLLVLFAVLSGVVLATLVVVRALRDWVERRRLRRAEATRGLLLALLFGDQEEAVAARARLTDVRGSRWDRVEQQVLTMLPKLKGESRADLVSLLLEKGAEQRALRLVRSGSAVRRCRGAHQLGQLGLVQHLDALIGLLSDRSFVVRRMAVRALGNLGDPHAVRPLLLLGEHDSRLGRDLVFALGRLGPAGAAELREVLATRLRAGEHLHLDPAAIVLGTMGDSAAVPVLVDGLDSENPSLAGSCAAALGRIGSPEAIPALEKALADYRPNVRSEAAQALGVIGSYSAIDSLLDVVDEEEPQVSRQAARALLDLGVEGRARLATSNSAYAVETLALQEIRAVRQ